MFTHYRTQGIVLKKEDRREADQVFTIFTKDFGRLEIMAKSVRKIKSKLRGGMELFYLSEIEFVQGKGYKTLTDALLVDKFKPIRNNLEKFKIAYQIASVFDKLIKGQEKDEKVWQLFKEVFRRLNSTADNNLGLLYHYFLWQFLAIQGYDPEHISKETNISLEDYLNSIII